MGLGAKGATALFTLCQSLCGSGSDAGVQGWVKQTHPCLQGISIPVKEPDFHPLYMMQWLTKAVRSAKREAYGRLPLSVYRQSDLVSGLGRFP